MKPLHLLLGTALALTSGWALAQKAPESLLPPGFDEPAPKAPPRTEPAPTPTPRAASGSAGGGASGGVSASASTSAPVIQPLPGTSAPPPSAGAMAAAGKLPPL